MNETHGDTLRRLGGLDVEKTVDYKAMSDEQLSEEYSRLFSSYMYYQAAEGNWSRETADRTACEREYYACQREVRSRGLDE